jgi:hypothetical protein
MLSEARNTKTSTSARREEGWRIFIEGMGLIYLQDQRARAGHVFSGLWYARDRENGISIHVLTS